MTLLRDTRVRASVERLEAEARLHPLRHAARLALWLVFGYAVPLALVVLSGLLVAVMPLCLPFFLEEGGLKGIIAWVAFFIGALAFAGWVVRAFMVELPEPDGRKLVPGEAPALRAMIEDVRAGLQAPPVEAIYLDVRLNAGVLQRFRWWIIGPSRNLVVIGLPLLAVCTPEDLRAVLAHEFGHLAGRHGRLRAWVTRLLATLEALANVHAQGKKASWLQRFLVWYYQHLSVVTLALRRRHEYDADQAAALLVGTPVAAHILTLLDWCGYRLSMEFMPAMRRLTAAQALPPADYLQRFTAVLTAPTTPEVVQAWWRRGCLRHTGIADEHPCLCDRLAAIGDHHLDTCPPAPPELAVPDTCALSLLGDAAERHVAVANATWKAMVAEDWRNEHTQATARLAAAGDPDAPDAETAWTAVQARAQYAEPAEEDALLRHFLARFPDHPGARYALGCHLLAREDDAGIPHLEAAIAAATEYHAPGLQHLLEYYRDQGRDAEADAVQVRLATFERTVAQAKRERASVSV